MYSTHSLLHTNHLPPFFPCTCSTHSPLSPLSYVRPQFTFTPILHRLIHVASPSSLSHTHSSYFLSQHPPTPYTHTHSKLFPPLTPLSTLTPTHSSILLHPHAHSFPLHPSSMYRSSLHPPICYGLSWYRQDTGVWYEDNYVGCWLVQDPRILCRLL